MNKMGKLFLSALSVVSFAACAVGSTDEASVLGESQDALTGPNGKGFFGSDTLRGAITDAITAAGLNANLTYLGTGSGNGEKCLRGTGPVPGGYCNGTIGQHIAPMSRPLNNIQPGEVNNCIAKDAIALWYDDSQAADDTTHGLISDAFCGTNFTAGKRNGTGCTVDTWGELDAGASNPSNNLRLFRRDDASGTTEVFKDKSACATFCPGVAVVEDGGAGIGPRLQSDTAGTSSLTGANTAARLANCPASPICAVGDTVTDCMGKIATCDNALVYAGLDAGNAGNQAFDIDGVPPTPANIRNGTYYYSRCLYLNEGTGTASAAEVAFLDWAYGLTDPADAQAFENILVSHGFIACTDPAVSPHTPLDCP